MPIHIHTLAVSETEDSAKCRLVIAGEASGVMLALGQSLPAVHLQALFILQRASQHKGVIHLKYETKTLTYSGSAYTLLQKPLH